MQPITRETVVDRRQPAIRWSAVFAGTAVALGLWGVLQVLGIGAGLAALDPDDVSSARAAALGTGVWSLIAPLIAMFAGGFVAAKLSNTYDRRVAGSHAVVMWGVAATAGLVFTVWTASHLAFSGAKHGEHMGDVRMGEMHRGDVRMGEMHRGEMGRHGMGQMGIVNDATTEARDALVPINNRLKLQGKPQITPEQLVAASRGAIDDGELDRDAVVKGLTEQTALSKDEADSVVTDLGPRAVSIATHATRAFPREHAAMYAAEKIGKGLLGLGVSILLGIGTAILGAMLAMRRFDKDRKDREVVETREVHTTAPYPPVTPTTPDV